MIYTIALYFVILAGVIANPMTRFSASEKIEDTNGAVENIEVHDLLYGNHTYGFHEYISGDEEYTASMGILMLRLSIYSNCSSKLNVFVGCISTSSNGANETKFYTNSHWKDLNVSNPDQLEIGITQPYNKCYASSNASYLNITMMLLVPNNSCHSRLLSADMYWAVTGIHMYC